MAVHPEGRGTAGEADGLVEVVDEEEVVEEAAVVVVAETEVELEADEDEDEAEEEVEDELAAGPAKTDNLEPAPQVCWLLPEQIMLHWDAGATALAG